MPISWIAKKNGSLQIASDTLFGSPAIIGGALYHGQYGDIFCAVRPDGDGWFKACVTNMAGYLGDAGALTFQVDVPQPAWLPDDSPITPISERHKSGWRFSPYAPAMVACIGYVEHFEKPDLTIRQTRFLHIGMLEIVFTPLYSGGVLSGLSVAIDRDEFEEFGIIVAADYAYRHPDDTTEYLATDPGKIRYIRNRVMVNATNAGHGDVIEESLGGHPDGTLGDYDGLGVYGDGITHSLSYAGPGTYTLSTNIHSGSTYLNFTDTMTASPSVVYAASGDNDDPSHWYEYEHRA